MRVIMDRTVYIKLTKVLNYRKGHRMKHGKCASNDCSDWTDV